MSRTPFCCLSRFVGSLFVARCSLHHRPSIHRMIDRVAIAIAIAVLFAIIGIGYSDTNACSALVRLSHAACCLLPVACCLLPAACLLRVCYCSFDYSNFCMSHVLHFAKQNCLSSAWPPLPLRPKKNYSSFSFLYEYVVLFSAAR